jgi:hypothetical protein
LVCSKHIAAPPFVLYPVNLSDMYPAGFLFFAREEVLFQPYYFFAPCHILYTSNMPFVKRYSINSL